MSENDPASPSFGPRNAVDLVGHAEAEQALAQARASGRMPHAWLLTGPRGIGKATLAFRFARAMLAGGKAKSPPPPSLFGEPEVEAAPPSNDLYLAPEHPVFARVASLGHADLTVVERGYDAERKRLRTEIVIDDVRKLNTFFSMTAAEGGWRIAIVDAADEMNRNAANALLKVLEEPPANSLLILIAHRPGLLLPTVRSRCRRLRLNPLSESQTEEIIAQHNPELDTAERQVLARLAEGSPGRGLALAEAGGVDLYGEFIARMGELSAADAGRLHVFADRLAQGDGGGFRAFGVMLDWWLARMIRGAGRGVEPAEVVPGEAEIMRALLRARGLDQWIAVWENLNQLFDRAESLALDRKQVVLNAFFALAPR